MWERFGLAIYPLHAAGKFGAAHFQFSPWMMLSREWHLHIKECAKRMRGYQLATEFRQDKWFDAKHFEATLEFERQLKFFHVVLDMPLGFKNRLPPVWQATNLNLAILR